MRKTALPLLTAALLSIAPVAAASNASAATDTPTPSPSTSAPATQHEDDDNGDKGLWGLLGLAGLAGLAGLRKKKDHHTPVQTTRVHTDDARTVRHGDVNDNLRRDAH